MNLLRIIALVLAAALAGCSATAKVKQQLIEEDDVNAASVNVTTYRGVVQLSGFVETEEARRRAENAANDVEGVRSVQNDPRIAPAGSGKTR
jgi:osmotically-inducible protein OsmY